MWHSSWMSWADKPLGGGTDGQSFLQLYQLWFDTACLTKFLFVQRLTVLFLPDHNFNVTDYNDWFVIPVGLYIESKALRFHGVAVHA